MRHPETCLRNLIQFLTKVFEDTKQRRELLRCATLFPNFGFGLNNLLRSEFRIISCLKACLLFTGKVRDRSLKSRVQNPDRF